jgi:hypothetical protein
MHETVPHLPQLLDAKFPGRARAGRPHRKGDAATRTY